MGPEPGLPDLGPRIDPPDPHRHGRVAAHRVRTRCPDIQAELLGDCPGGYANRGQLRLEMAPVNHLVDGETDVPAGTRFGLAVMSGMATGVGRRAAGDRYRPSGRADGGAAIELPGRSGRRRYPGFVS